MQRLRPADPLLFGLSLLATLVGVLFIFNAGFARSLASGDGWFPPEARQQLIYLPVALVAYLVCARMPEKVLQKGSKAIWCLGLLLVALVKVIGHEQNGAQRWIDIGPVSIQPAEFAKLAAVIYLAGVFAGRPAWKEWPLQRYWTPEGKKRMWTKFKRILPIIWVLVAVYLIEEEPDLGTAAVIAVTAFAMCYLGGANRWTLWAGVVLGGLVLVYMVKSEPYRMERISNHFHRWEARNVDSEGYQTVQSEIAMARGGALRMMPGSGRAKHVMPATTTDFLIATPAEEFGLLGALTVIALFGAVAWRLVVLAPRAPTDFSRLVLMGIAIWIGVQGATNVMMANGTLPAIGIPLPFLSSGGSSLLALWMAVGVAQSMVTQRQEAQDETRTYGWGNRRTHLPST